VAKTRHIHQRMSQRGVTERMLEIVTEFGMVQGDKVVLDKKNIDALLIGMEKLKKDFIKVRDKGGLVVVEANDKLITTYNVDSFDRSKKKMRH